MESDLTESVKPVSRRRRAYSGLVVEVFRLNGEQIAVGNAIGAAFGLTSARWQVLGAISLSAAPLPVPHIARTMGLTRQAVQRTVDEMRAQDLVRLEPNPHHRRAMLVAVTEKGEAAYRGASERHGRWAEGLFGDIPLERIEAARAVLHEILCRIARSTTMPTAEVEEM